MNNRRRCRLVTPRRVARSSTLLLSSAPFAISFCPRRTVADVPLHAGYLRFLLVPFAIGAKAAAPDDTVVCVTGDGAFGIGAMEIDTAVRLDLPFICVIGNDQIWGMIERSQSSLFGEDRLVAAKLGDRPYEKMAEALGGYGERVEDPEQIRPALERARDSGKPACLNVMLDPKLTG